MGFEKMQISPDNRTLVTASFNSMQVWSITDGKLLGTLKINGSSKALQFSPNGQLLASAFEDGSIRIWHYKDLKEVLNISTGTSAVEKIQFANNGKILLAQNDSLVVVFDMLANKKRITFKYPGFICMMPDINHSAQKIVTTSDDMFLRYCNLKNGMVEDSIKLNEIAYGVDIELSPRGNYVFIKGEKPKVWDINKKKLLALNENEGFGTVGSFSADNRKIAIGHTAVTGQDLSAKIFVWSLAEGKNIKVIKGSSHTVTYISISPNGQFALLNTKQNQPRIWDMQYLKTLHNFNGYLNYFVTGLFSPDSKKMLTIKNDYKHNDDTPQFWDIQSGAKIGALVARVNDYACPMLNSDGSLLYLPVGNKVRIENLKTGEVKTLEGHETGTISMITISPNGKLIATASSDNTVRIWDALTLQTIFELKGHSQYVYYVNFSPSGNLLCSSAGGSVVKLWETHTGKLLHTFQNANGGTFLNNEQWLGTSSLISGDDAKIWNLQDGSLKFNLAGQSPQYSAMSKTVLYRDSATNNYITYDLDKNQKKAEFFVEGTVTAKLIAEKNTVLISTWDGQMKWFNASTGKEIVTTVFIDDIDFVSILPSGYYFASTNAAKKIHYVNKKLKSIPFNQLDIKYNRPDKVLESIGNKDTILINSYRKAYQKRIKKLGIDTTQFKDGYSVPESDFINREVVEYEQSKDKLILKINGNDSSYKLDRMNVWVNEVPLFGLRGINISKKNRNSFDTALTITLSQGENRIETSVINANGTESYRMPLLVKYSPALPKIKKLHFIGIGINQFANAEYNLSWSVKDIRDLSLKLKSKYPNIIIDTLFDGNVTKENVLALKEKLLLLNEDDKVIVSYSGHGVLSKELDYYLSTYSINFDSPEEKGLAYDDLESLLDNIKPRQKMMFIDACHSGEVDKDEIAKIEASKKSLDSMGTKSKSTIKIIPNKNLGMANSFELMQSLFVNVGKGTGATIISAAGGMQYAQERGDLKNGVFTYSILEAFNNNPSLKVSELKKIVGTRVIQLTNGLQKPTSRNETNNYDWVIW